MPISREQIAELVTRALQEDLDQRGDVTGNTIFPADLRARARIVAREPLVLAGLPFAIETFEQLDPQMEVDVLRREGDRVPAGECVATVSGGARPLLAGERTALNFLMRLSGIATATRACVDEVAGTGADILDTRKTAPGLRMADKYAVSVGGGRNHRLGLYDEAMIKDTHLVVQPDIQAAVGALLATGLEPRQITVEVRDLHQLGEAIAGGAGRALLDNMDLETMREAVVMAGGRNHRMGLYDAAMVKDTHLAVRPDIGDAVARLRAAGMQPEQITVEVRDLQQLAAAVEAGAGRALLDNMDLDAMREAVAFAKGKIELEASGGLRPGNLRAVAETGVDCLSLGALTHSSRSADLAMETETTL